QIKKRTNKNKMEKVINFIQKNKYILGATAAASTALFILHQLTKESEVELESVQDQLKKVENQEQKQQQQNNPQCPQGGEYNTKLNEICTYLQGLKFDKNSIEYIYEIMQNSIKLVEEEYVQMTKTNRNLRRQLLQNNSSEQYLDAIMKYNEDIEKSLENANKQIIAKLGISSQEFEDSVIQLMEQGRYQEIYMLQATMRQKMKEFIKNDINVQVTIDQMKELIQYQINLLNEKPALIKEAISKMSQNQETVQQIPIIISTMLNDYVFEKFKLEEEDQMKFMANPNVLRDQEIITLLQQIEQSMYMLMSSLAQ
ncbi:hypothetical protein IMG5_106950, partial [Ichthyophthirius multifiliis]